MEKKFRFKQKNKTFEMYLEEVKVKNSDKEIKLKDYRDKVKNYTTNKDKFKPIFTKDQKTWEDEAEKIINNNKYLGYAWTQAKAQHDIDIMNDKVTSNELSPEEITDMKTKIKAAQDELKKDQIDLDKEVKGDLTNIQNFKEDETYS